MDLLKKTPYNKDFQIKMTPTILKLLENTRGTAEMIEVPKGALLILKIPVDERILKDVVSIMKSDGEQ